MYIVAPCGCLTKSYRRVREYANSQTTPTIMSKGQRPSQPQTRGEMDGTKPVTDRDSKMVMLRAERGDIIDKGEVISKFEEGQIVPDRLEVQRRVSTFYGAELLLEPTNDGCREKYLITAPGPDSYLYIWSSETDEDGFREGWNLTAEIKASFSEEIPRYSLCSRCGEPIKSLEHARLATTDSCPVDAD